MVSKKETIWVLTFEVNEYDQHGEYFVTAFRNKPTMEQLIPYTTDADGASSVPEYTKFLLHLVNNGGGRIGTEWKWYTLAQIESDN